MSTYVYIDGLNFYYGSVSGTVYKWLDFEALVRTLVPHDTISLIRYFTAPVKPRFPGDRAHERQNAYLRAMRTNPLIEVTLGHFRMDDRWRALADTRYPVTNLFRPRLRPAFLVRAILGDAKRRRTAPATVARVIVPEEKGSDVNLATYLLYDAFTKPVSKSVVISNDSDLAEAVKLTVQQGVAVGIVNPHHSHLTSAKLKAVASFEIPFRQNVVAQCQLPNVVIGRKGKQIHKPTQW